MESRRAQRVAEALREELAELVGYELQDPRLVGVTVVEAMLTPDGRHARISVIVGGDAAERRGALEALEHAANYLRRQVAVRLRLFRAPELHFEEDPAAGGETRIDQLLKRIHKAADKACRPGAGHPQSAALPEPASEPAEHPEKSENSSEK
jgi:ribosome-binding factor A